MMTDQKDKDTFSLCEGLARWAPDIIYVVDKSGSIREGNDKFWTESGLSRDSAGPAALLGLMSEEYRQAALRTWAAITQFRKPMRSTIRFKTKRGDLKVFDVNEAPLQDDGDRGLIIGIGRDVSEEFAIEEKLWSSIDARESALEYSVRASLGLVKGYVYSLHKLDDMPAEKRSRFVRIIADEVDAMSRGIENLLYGRGNGEIRAEQELFDPWDAIIEGMHGLQSEAVRRSVKLSLQRPDSELSFYGQPLAVTRIVENLIEFCMLRVTHAGEIKLSLSDSLEYIEVVIEDSGPAITPEQAEWLLSANRVLNTEETVSSGSKFDLEVARLLANSMGGGITAEPLDERGLRFTVMFPRSSIVFGRDNAAEAAVSI